jgi:DNA-binding transcriptional LysR family regulator
VLHFCRKFPNIRISLVPLYPGPQSLEPLITGQVDLALMPFGPSEPHNPLVVTEVLCVRKPVLAMPQGHPLALVRRITLTDLVRYPLIMAGPDNYYRKQLEEIYRQDGLIDRLKIVMEVTNSEITRRYVSRGLGIAIVPLLRNELAIAGLVTRPLPERFPGQPIAVLWRRGATPRPQAQQFVQLVRECLAEE